MTKGIVANPVMHGPARTLDSGMTLQVEVELDGIHNGSIDDAARGCVPAPVFIAQRIQARVVPL